ncbi:MAG TPA: PAS domain-containing protein [Dongiaceae bacterium]|nr:PAS domain-containing protein [Dongiaceae bacterium]
MLANTVSNLTGRNTALALWILPLTGLALLAWMLLGPELALSAPVQTALRAGALATALLCAPLAWSRGLDTVHIWPGLMALGWSLLALVPWLVPGTGSDWTPLLQGMLLVVAALFSWRDRVRPPAPASRRFGQGILAILAIVGGGVLLEASPLALPGSLLDICMATVALLLSGGLLGLTPTLRRRPGRSSLALLLCLLLHLGALASFDTSTSTTLTLQLLAWLVLFAGLCPTPGSQVDEQERISQKVLVGLMADFQKAREEEAQAKQFAESIIENLPLMLFVKDAAELRFQRINKYGEFLLSQNRDQLIGKNDYDFFPPDQADFFTATDRAVLAGNDIVDIAEECVTTGAGERWLHTRKIPLRNSRGQPQFLLGISEDITAQRELELRFTSLFDAAPNGLVLLDRDDRIVLANASACALFGYRNEELIGSPITRLIPTRDHDIHTETQRMAGRPNLAGLHRDGHDIPVEIALQPLPWLGQQHVLASITDVTERQRFISEIEQASRYKSQFLANMSHELRTPMNSIIGFTEKVLKSAQYLTPRHRDALETVQRNAHHLLDLISDVLDLSKIEAGRMDVELKTLDLRPLLEQTRDEFALVAKKKGLALELVMPPGALMIRTDRGKLVQICNNLLSNAVKYTERGTVTLRVEPQVTDIGAAVILHFQDTGLGIQPDDQQKLFKEFARAREAREKRIQGTGLGLLITAQLAALLGGSINMSSQHGQGSTFSVILPATVA